MNKRIVYNPKVNKKRVPTSDSFLEALRDLGGGVADSLAQDVVGGVAEEAVNQLTGRKSGELKPDQPLELDTISQKAEIKERQTWSFQQDFLDIRRQEKLVWTKKQQETELQIKAILEELGKLVEATKELAKEVETASKQTPTDPGVYHLSFFERLRETIILFRKRIEESVTWLSAVNQKSKKRNYYWAQVRKSGTKFLLSQERYMATQAG